MAVYFVICSTKLSKWETNEISQNVNCLSSLFEILLYLGLVEDQRQEKAGLMGLGWSVRKFT